MLFNNHYIFVYIILNIFYKKLFLSVDVKIHLLTSIERKSQRLKVVIEMIRKLTMQNAYQTRFVEKIINKFQVYAYKK